MTRRHLVSAVIALSSALLVTSCSTTLQGKAVSVFDDPFSVAGMPATDGPTGLRSDPAKPTRAVLGTDDGDMDELGRQAISDIEEFWEGAYGESFDGEFRPVEDVYLLGRERIRRHRVLRRQHVRDRERGFLPRRPDHRVGPR